MSTIPQKSFPQRLQEGFRNFGSALEDRFGALNLFQKKQTPKTAETLLKRAQELLLTTRTLEEYKVGSKDDHSLTKKKLDFMKNLATILIIIAVFAINIAIISTVVLLFPYSLIFILTNTFVPFVILAGGVTFGLSYLLNKKADQKKAELAVQQDEKYKDILIELEKLVQDIDEIKFEPNSVPTKMTANHVSNLKYYHCTIDNNQPYEFLDIKNLNIEEDATIKRLHWERYGNYERKTLRTRLHK